MKPREHGAMAGVTVEQMRGAVLSITEQKGWTSIVRKDGTVRVEMGEPDSERKAVVDVVLKDRTYVVRYVESDGLEYDDELCVPIPGDHRRSRCREVIDIRYNNWAEDFEEQIGAQIARLRPGDPVDERAAVPPPPPSAAAIPPDRCRFFVADEIRKLQELQEEGALTEEEFEAQKRKLLSR